VFHNVQGCLLPRCACAASPRSPALRGLSRSVLPPAFNLAHVTPIKADKNEEKTMNIINIALLLNAIAQLIAAFAKFINAIRHRR
jgi:hypothetical protein